MENALVDPNCVMLDGNCDCPRKKNHMFPKCLKYPKGNFPQPPESERLWLLPISPNDAFAEYVTNPMHGGKVTCLVCNGFIDGRFKYIKRGNEYEHMPHCM